MPTLADRNGSDNVTRALSLLQTLSQDYNQLTKAEEMELEDCLLRVEAVARRVPDTQTRKLACLYDVQILLMKEQRMVEQEKYKTQEKDLEIANLKLQLAHSNSTLQLHLATDTIKKAETELLAEQSKLHMRGLIEHFESLFKLDEDFKKKLHEREESIKRKFIDNDGKLQDNMPQVTRREKWLMALDCSRFGDLAENIMEQCKICRTDIATQINALLKTLNGIVHNPLCDVIDPTTTTCLVINKLVVGEMQARLLECIAIKCQINSVVIPQVP